MIISSQIRALLTSILLLSALFIAQTSQAAIDTFEFENAQQEQTFHELTKLLRCPKCQNNNIADSNAELAKDLRNKTYELVSKGQTKEQVIDYMVARYGNFVRYDPPVTPATIFLWLGPLLFVLLALFVLIRQVKAQPSKEVPLDDAEKQKLEKLLAQQHKQGPK